MVASDTSVYPSVVEDGSKNCVVDIDRVYVVEGVDDVLEELGGLVVEVCPMMRIQLGLNMTSERKITDSVLSRTTDLKYITDSVLSRTTDLKYRKF